jgi:putative membrane protein
MSWIEKYLTQEDFKKIETSIAHVESETSGEIVPVIVRRSSAVGHVPLTLTLLLTLLALVVETPFSDWLWIRPWVYLWPALIVVFYFIALVLARSQWIQKVLVSEKDELHQVHQRAELEFYKNKINRTQDGTGVLIFVSVMEKKAVILADEGISQKLPPETWNEVLNQFKSQLGRGDWAQGFTEAIENCGKHLKTHFPISSAAKNELKNHLIVKD